jgi:glucose-1-phosphate adenylyltransferase
VHDRSIIDRSVILPRVRIGENCVIRGAVIDEGTLVPDGTRIGVDSVADAERFHVTEGGIVLVTSAMLKAASRPA